MDGWLSEDLVLWCWIWELSWNTFSMKTGGELFIEIEKKCKCSRIENRKQIWTCFRPKIARILKDLNKDLKTMNLLENVIILMKCFCSCVAGPNSAVVWECRAKSLCKLKLLWRKLLDALKMPYFLFCCFTRNRRDMIFPYSPMRFPRKFDACNPF